MPGQKNVLSPGDISKLSGQVAGVATELSGRLQEIIEIKNSLTSFTPYAKNQLQELEAKILEHGVKKQFNELHTEFKRQIATPFERTVKKSTELIKKFQEKLQPRVAKLPQADNLQFPQLCAQIELTWQDFSKIHNEINPQVQLLAEQFTKFASMLLLPEAELQIKSMEKSADKLANDIAKMATKLACLEEEDNTPLSLEQLCEKLETLAMQSRTLKTARQRNGFS